LIAADVVLGLPGEPTFLWGNCKSFPEWLDTTKTRIGKSNWRNEVIADSLADQSSARPFVKVEAKTKKQIAFKRLCDEVAGGESVYCIDSGAKQVGRASLQFWFEVLMPLKLAFSDQVAIWPFESDEDKSIVVAECYPTASQKDLNLPAGIKRNAPKVVEAVLGLRRSNSGIQISDSTWFHAVSSEDEYDTFTTAYAFAKRGDVADLMWFPNGPEFDFVRTHEGWMLGLRETAKPEKAARKSSSSRRGTGRSTKIGVGQRNRNEQENLGPVSSGENKGRRISMKCRKMNGTTECGHQYETNPQDVFQKKCPVCQGGK
jgi:hypothetical protein